MADKKISALTTVLNSAVGSGSFIPLVDSIDNTTKAIILSQLDLRWSPNSISLTGDATGSGSNGALTTAISAATVTGKLITGFVSGAGTVAATDSILQAIQKLDGNVSGKLTASMAANTIKGNNTAGVANAVDLTATQATAMLNAFPGDSGSGAVKGLVPAAAAGDAAAGKYLKADGTWTAPAGGGGGITALTSEVTASGTGTVAATVSNAAVIGKVITGFTSGAGTVAATDTILQAIQKLDGNISGKQASGNYLTSLTGEVTASGPGAGAATLSNSAVIGKVITGYTSGAGTVAATDTILQAIQKLNGNTAAKLTSPLTTKGDLHGFTTVDARVGVGADGTVLTADSTASAGVKWANASGGGGGSLQWIEDDSSPVSSVENNIRVYAYNPGALNNQGLYCLVKVPTGYTSGNPIKLRVPFYSPDSSGTILMETIATLIRSGTDAMSSNTNQRTSTNTAVTLGAGTVNIPQAVIFDLTDTTGKINSVSVSPGDLIQVKLSRATDTGVSDSKIPAFAAEVTFT